MSFVISKKFARRVKNGKAVTLDDNNIVDWTKLTKELVIEFFSRLNVHDRASLSSTCKTWRNIGTSAFLWHSLDVRAYKFDVLAAQSLASRCKNLRRLIFNEAETPYPIEMLQARNLTEIIGYQCIDITDATLSEIVSLHPFLQTLQLGLDHSERRITSQGIETVANYCPNLRKLKLCGIRDINEVAISSLATCCQNLVELGFIDCLNINEIALGRVLSLKFLSVAGTSNISWVSISNSWTRLPNLVGLDISRTDVDDNCITMLLSSFSSCLSVLCALDCPLLPSPPATSRNRRDGATKLLSETSDIYQWLCSSTVNVSEKEETPMVLWLEQVFANLYLRHCQSNPEVTSEFWNDSAAMLIFRLIRSPQENVVETGLEILSSITIAVEESIQVHEEHNKMMVGDEEIRSLLRYSKSHHECLQLQAIKAIANLSHDSYIRKSIVKQGGIAALSNLTKSTHRLVVKEAVKGLLNLSICCDYQVIFIGAGAIKALVEMLAKCPTEDILEHAVNALANLADHEDCAEEIKKVDGVTAIWAHVVDCHFPKVTEEALCAMNNLFFHGYREHVYADAGEAAAAFDSLKQLTCSIHYGIRLEAVDALWNFWCCEQDPDEAADLVEVFVALVQPGNSPSLQQKVIGLIRELSVDKVISMIVGEQGTAALITLIQSDVAEVRDCAAGALCHLAFLPCNALRIKNGNGITAIINLYKLTQSKATRFYLALALACMHDYWMVQYEKACIGAKSKTEENRDKELASVYISDFILDVCDPTIFSFIAGSPTSSILQKQAKALYIDDVGCFESRDWFSKRLIDLLSDSSSDIKACAAFALVQYITPCNSHWMDHTKYVQEAGETRVLRALAASKSSPNSVKVLAKIVLFCFEQNQKELQSTSGGQRRERNRKLE